MARNRGPVVTDCAGREPLGTHVDEEMHEYVEREADRLGVTNSEFLRLLLVAYRGDARLFQKPGSLPQQTLL